jgi:hypothetical protein
MMATLLFPAMPIEQRQAIKEAVKAKTGEDPSFIDVENGVINLPDLATMKDPQSLIVALGQVTVQRAPLDDYIDEFGRSVGDVADNKK